MVRRNGQPAEHTVPGFAGRLTRSELEAYDAAFRTIRQEFPQLEKLQDQVNHLGKIRWDHPAALRHFTSLLTEDARWDAYGVLLKTSASEVLLCRKAEGTEWAAIQRLSVSAPYAQAHGATEVLFTGNDARTVTNEYAAQAQHTLRFMASNLVARTQKIVWDQYSHANPDRVMRALSERCAHVVNNTEVVREVQSVKESVTQAPRQSRSMRV